MTGGGLLARDFAIVAAIVLAGAVVLWWLAVRRGDVSIIDIAWGPGFPLVAVVLFPIAGGDPGRRGLLLLCTALWGLRLGTYLWLRKRGQGEDPRYTALRKHVGAGFERWALTRIFLFQGAVMLVVALPVVVGMHNPDPGALTAPAWIGVVVYAVGLMFEAVGDAQLARFKRDPANGGRVMDRGLWRYTRHPNYFGDACVWIGIWLIAAVNLAGALTVVSPLVMGWVLYNVTGKRVLEHRMTRRSPAYADYVARTSGFLPLPPRRAAAPRPTET